MTNLVFVYGTLRKDQRNNERFLAKAQFCGDAKTVGLFTMLDCCEAYPIVAIDEPAVIIVGELYSVDSKTMDNLDGLEGYPAHYQRREIMVTPQPDGKPVMAWMYYQFGSERSNRERQAIAGGDWVEYKKELKEMREDMAKYSDGTPQFFAL